MRNYCRVWKCFKYFNEMKKFVILFAKMKNIHTRLEMMKSYASGLKSISKSEFLYNGRLQSVHKGDKLGQNSTSKIHIFTHSHQSPCTSTK